MLKLLKQFISSVLLSLIVSHAMADLNDGLMAYYPFDGNAHDVSGNNNHGVEYGEVRYINNNVREFDRQGGYEYILFPNTLNSNSYSVSLCTNLRKIDTHNSLLMLNSTLSWVWSDFWLFTSHGRIAVIQAKIDLRYDDYWEIFSNSKVLENNNFYLITVTYGEGSIKIYVNTKLYAEYNEIPSIPHNNADLNMGISPNGTGQYQIDGVIDDLRIYNRVLSQSEIEALYLNNKICNPSSSEVDLISFKARTNVENNGILVEWETSTERASSQFRLWRFVKISDGKYTNPTLLIEKSARGEATIYSYQDLEVEMGKTYAYRLSEIETNGNEIFYLDEPAEATIK